MNAIKDWINKSCNYTYFSDLTVMKMKLESWSNMQSTKFLLRFHNMHQQILWQLFSHIQVSEQTITTTQKQQ